MDDYDNVSVSVPVEMLLMIWGKEREPVETTGCELCTRHYERWEDWRGQKELITDQTDEWTKTHIYNQVHWAWVRFNEHVHKCLMKKAEEPAEKEETVVLQGKWQTRRGYNKGEKCWLCKDARIAARGMCNRCYQAAKRLHPDQPVA